MVLALLVVGVVFVPEVRELIRVVLVALWELVLEGLRALTDLVQSRLG